jgi:predicted dehydrogenase
LSKRNRREFLEQSMFAAAAAATAGAGNDHLLAEEDVQSTSPNEKLGVVVVGVRGRGGSHIGAFAGRRDTEILYVCDADAEVGGNRTKEITKRQGREPQFVEDIRDALDDRRVDIVSIATPNHLHALQAIWAIQAGRDVYVEKPVSHNVSEGRRIVEAARTYNRICQTGTQCRSNPGMISAIEFVRSGKIGDVKIARGLCYKRRPSIGEPGEYTVPSSVNYDLWLGPAPLAPLTRPKFHYDWHWQWPYGSGDLGNQGIHQMDLARWGLGADRLSDSVISYGGRLGCVDAGETANTQIVIHNFGEQTLIFEVRELRSSDYRGAKVGIIFEGSGGTLVMKSYNKGAAFDLDGNVIERFAGGGDHFANFLKAVRSRNHEDLNADILEGHLSSALCHLGNISYRLGASVTAGQVANRLQDSSTSDRAGETLERTLKHLRNNGIALARTEMIVGPQLAFDHVSESFTENEQANAMLTRQYRKPFVVPPAGEV